VHGPCNMPAQTVFMTKEDCLMCRAVLFVCLFFVMLPAAWAAPNPALDLDFEAPECTSGWQLVGSWQYPYDNVIDTTVAQSGSQSFKSRYTGPSPWTFRQGTGGNLQEFPAADVAGKQMRLSGYIRSEAIDLGYAGFYVAAYPASGGLVYADMFENGVTGTTPWTRYELVLDVPADTAVVLFGAELFGGGTAWFDNFQVEIDGKRWKDGKADHLLRPTPGHVQQVRRAAIPLTTAVAGNGFADLQPLRNVIGDARIVALGEGTHGTREFFQMKHRLVEFLATEMGFTTFAIEANMPEAYRVNEYVLTGQGDPAELLEGMLFWTWNTQEVLDMILWMRDFNASGRGRIQFTGFDMQFSAASAQNVRTFLAQAEPAYLPTANAAFALIAAAERRARATAAEVAAARNVHQHLVAQRDVYLQTLSREQVDWALQNARLVVQTAEALAGLVSRDQAMAENVSWILDQAPAGSKIVLWAHNGHVNKVAGWMGDFLDRRYGDDMYVLGFAFGEGRYNALSAGPQLTSHQALPPVPGSLESLLSATGLPRFLLDLRHGNAPHVWFDKPRFFRNIGAIATHCAFSPTVAAEAYDGLVWIDPTSPSVLLPFD
jgi:erythromycin esterase